jgi:hypothetical protein
LICYSLSGRYKLLTSWGYDSTHLALLLSFSFSNLSINHPSAVFSNILFVISNSWNVWRQHWYENLIFVKTSSFEKRKFGGELNFPRFKAFDTKILGRFKSWEMEANLTWCINKVSTHGEVIQKCIFCFCEFWYESRNKSHFLSNQFFSYTLYESRRSFLLVT